MNPRMPLDEPLPDYAEVSFVPMAAVEEESGRLNASQVRALGSVRRGYTHFIENDVIFAKITPCMENGKIALATGLKNGLAYGSTEFFIFRPYKGLLPRFVLYFLLQPSLRKKAERQMAGASGQKRVPAHYLFTHEFLLPPTHEQERIVSKLDAALSSLERAEIAARRAQKRINRYRAAVLHAAATGELTRAWRDAHRNNEGETESGDTLLRRLIAKRRARWEEAELARLRTIAKTRPRNDVWRSRYRDPNPPDRDSLVELPSEWAWASIDQLAWDSGYGTSVKCTPEGKGPAVLRIPNIRERALDFSELKFASDPREIATSQFVAPGDLLLIRTNGSKDLIGRAAVVKTEPLQKCAFASYLIRFRLVGRENLWSWLGLAWDSRLIRAQIEAKAKTTAGQYNVALSGLKGTAIPLPPQAEQSQSVREVERRLAAAARLASKLDHQLERSRATRESLFGEAFTGGLVIQDPTDESALVLLDRIRAEKAAEPGRSRRGVQPSTPEKKRDSMKEQALSPESLAAAWERIGRKADARRLFNEAGFGSDNVVQFYEALRATPQVRAAFQKAADRGGQKQKPVRHTEVQYAPPSGRFRLVDLWLEDFKNLKDYTVHFDPTQGLDVVLGWNGTGKSNLFEALVIIFRDLHEWWEKNRWPEKPMNGFRLSYEMDEHMVEITWQPTHMKRPELKRGLISRKTNIEADLKLIKREQLPLPRFVFGYYSGPTNRLAEHFLPMKQDHYDRLRLAKADDAKTLAKLLEQRRFFCAETHHAKYVLLGFSYKNDPKISEFLEDRLRIVGFESALFIIRKPLWAKSGSQAEDFWNATGIMRRVMERLRRYAIAPMVLQQKVNVARLCAMNLFLHGIGTDHKHPVISICDSLESKADPVDMVLTNPPFGKKSSFTIIGADGNNRTDRISYERDDFWATTSNKQLNFVQHVYSMLKENGRAAIVVPDNVLFEGGAGEKIRRALLQQCDVHTLLRLPTGIWYSPGVKANVLFFDKKPIRQTPATKEMWVYDLRSDRNFSLRQNPIAPENLMDFVDSYRPGDPNQRKETAQFRRFRYSEIMARDKANLDIQWQRSTVNASKEETPQSLMKEILKDLEDAIKEFANAESEISH